MTPSPLPSDIAHIIQLAIAPVFTLAGIGALLNVMANRLARVVDRWRALEANLSAADDRTSRLHVTELGVLDRRMAHIHRAIAFSTLAALLICIVIILLFTGQLLPQLAFPLDFDYLHVTRYGDVTTGGQLAWIVEPRASVAGRVVLVVDDILDQGVTMAAIVKRLREQGAAAVFSAVFADKDIGRAKPVAADFVGVHLPNRYVFGYGMDVKGAWRNLPAVYAVRGM